MSYKGGRPCRTGVRAIKAYLVGDRQNQKRQHLPLFRALKGRQMIDGGERVKRA